jgi:gamma-glutamylcyclotransferase (GGCT)/AIG2-like uncharacterized protein YtfP
VSQQLSQQPPQSLAQPSEASELIRVFVYGTLKPGEANYADYCRHAVQVEAAIVLGQLYHLPFGYPALTVGSRPVQGFLLSFADPDILSDLDQLEGYDPAYPSSSEYLRVMVDVLNPEQQPLGQAWTYQMPVDQVEKLGGILLPHGQWSSRRRILATRDSQQSNRPIAATSPTAQAMTQAMTGASETTPNS